MSFWNNINDELKTATEEGIAALRDGIRTGGLRLRLHNVKRKIHSHLASIGAVVYELEKTPWENPLSNPQVRRLIADVKRLEAEADSISEDLKAAGKTTAEKSKRP
ncbi:MAG: hypothetical protein A3J24_05555 [Deltaproteobacteria bacterium RIFCSPLOWO2_02_FULL_53_8]|nr:MAG: hypothetical protein A3J24_05555 [Deltaproteobacteria bacterium RIFCSPLOWO2_02_FULL_53_8]